MAQRLALLGSTAREISMGSNQTWLRMQTKARWFTFSARRVKRKTWGVFFY